MLRIAGQTVGPIGLKFFVDTHGRPGGVIGKKIFEHFFPNNFFLVFYHGKAGPSASLLYSKTREFIYMLRMDGQTAGPIGLNFFCGHSWVAEGCLAKNN